MVVEGHPRRRRGEDGAGGGELGGRHAGVSLRIERPLGRGDVARRLDELRELGVRDLRPIHPERADGDAVPRVGVDHVRIVGPHGERAARDPHHPFRCGAGWRGFGHLRRGQRLLGDVGSAGRRGVPRVVRTRRVAAPGNCRGDAQRHADRPEGDERGQGRAPRGPARVARRGLVAGPRLLPAALAHRSSAPVAGRWSGEISSTVILTGSRPGRHPPVGARKRWSQAGPRPISWMAGRDSGPVRDGREGPRKRPRRLHGGRARRAP